MKITYDIGLDSQTYESCDPNLNFLLSKEDAFLNLGIVKNTSKEQGYHISGNNSYFKIIDEFVIEGANITQVKYDGFKVIRKFHLGHKGYEDIFYLCSDGIVYSSNFSGYISLDIDMRKNTDYDTWGRSYSISFKRGITIIHYKKEKTSESSENYELFLAISGAKIKFENVGEWIQKNYEYSKSRGSLSDLYIYRAIKFRPKPKEKIFLCAGLSEDEAISKLISLKSTLNKEYRNDKIKAGEFMKSHTFKNLLNIDTNLAYKLSNNSILKLHTSRGSVAGLPWFMNIWSRDELASLNGFILNECFDLVKERLDFYIGKINPQTGLIKRIDENGSLESCDSVFWLLKRQMDFISVLKSKSLLEQYYKKDDLETIFRIMKGSLKKIIEGSYNRDCGLLKVKNGDSWMDTIDVRFPLDIQVQMLGFISSLSQFAQMVGKNEDEKDYFELEQHFRENLRKSYFKNFMLYSEPDNQKISSNIFLAFYFYPSLLSQKEWEAVFDNALRHLKTDWGGVSSLSRFDSNFQSNYTGENNLSYHNGDSWFWINNIAAMALNNLNERKYRDIITKIISSSTHDILKEGCIGFASEISSASTQKAQGCFAQLWSSAFYIEMIDKIFEKEN